MQILHYRHKETSDLDEGLDKGSNGVLKSGLQILGESTLIDDAGKEISLVALEVGNEVWQHS